MKIYKTLLVFAIITSFVALSSCRKDDDPVLNVTASEGTEFTAMGGAKYLEVECSDAWTLTITSNTGDSEWIQPDITTGTGNKTIHLTAPKNGWAETRSATLTFTAPSLVKEVTMTQLGSQPSLKVNQEYIILGVFETQRTAIIIEANTSWSVSADEAWVSLSKAQGKGNDTIYVSGEYNDGGERSASLTISATSHELTKHVAITQKSINDALFRDPVTEWGISPSDVKSHMSAYTLYSENTHQLVYTGLYREELTGYFFDNNKLVHSVVAILKNLAPYSDLTQDIAASGYTRKNKSMDGFQTFRSLDDKTFVIIEEAYTFGLYYVRYKDYSEPFVMPYYSWNMSKSSAKTALEARGYSLIDDSNSASEGYALYYAGRRMDELVIYLFDSSKRLYRVGQVFDTSLVSFDRVCTYLTSHMGYYKFTDVSNGVAYRSKNGNTVAIVILQVQNGNSLVYLLHESWEHATSQNARTRGSNPDTVLENVQLHGMSILRNRKTLSPHLTK